MLVSSKCAKYTDKSILNEKNIYILLKLYQQECMVAIPGRTLEISFILSHLWLHLELVQTFLVRCETDVHCICFTLLA